MIITLEGAPAVGKSTTSQALVQRQSTPVAECRYETGYGAMPHIPFQSGIQQHQSTFVVPEVNKLFARPQQESDQWYLHRQVARWEIGLRQIKSFDNILFDGDLFQPLWFGWIYNDESWTGLDESEAFYRREIMAGRIGFPDVYVIFWASAEERRLREYERGRALNRSETQIQEKYQKYERFVNPHLQYFKAFQQLFPERAQFIQSTTVEENMEAIASIPIPQKSTPDLEILDSLLQWLRTNSPEQ